MCITKQKKILLSQGKYQFTDEAKSPTLKTPTRLLSKLLVELEAETKKHPGTFYMKRYNTANYDGRWKRISVLFTQALQ